MPLKFLKVAIALAILTAPISVMGEKTLTLDEAVSEALEANPALKAQEAEVGAYQARIGAAKSLDDPMLGVEFYDVPIDTIDVTKGMETNYSVIQKIPFPGKRAARGRIARNEFLAQKSVLEGHRIGLIVKTEHAFHDLYFLKHSETVNAELQGLWKKLVAFEEARYATGRQGSQNLAKAKLELDRLQSEESLLRAREIEAQANLNILRHRSPSEPVRLAPLPEKIHTIPTYPLFEKAVLERHPEITAREYTAASRRAGVSYAKKEASLPDFQTRFAYAKRYGVEDNWTGEMMINIPFFWSKNRKTLEEAKALQKASEWETLSARDRRLAGLKESYAHFESSENIHRLFRSQILPHATVAFRSAQSAYAAGETDFLTLVDTARQLKEAKLGGVEAFVNCHRAFTHLKEAAGFDFSKEGL